MLSNTSAFECLYSERGCKKGYSVKLSVWECEKIWRLCLSYDGRVALLAEVNVEDVDKAVTTKHCVNSYFCSVRTEMP